MTNAKRFNYEKEFNSLRDLSPGPTTAEIQSSFKSIRM